MTAMAGKHAPSRGGDAVGANKGRFYREEVARLGLAVNELFPGALIEGVKSGKNITDVAIEKLTKLAAEIASDGEA